MKVAEISRDFTFKWHDLNIINECIYFHNHHKPDPPGYGNQAAKTESERYNVLEHTVLTDRPQDKIPSSSHDAHFLKFHTNLKFLPGDLRN